ncbi:MAG TPA: GNAT family protein [Pyrinomonadaceae bacterium]|nr:GNAT family protein [Pyrinomonadaceae bacterium]
MEIELRRTTDKDLSFVLAAESDEENRPFITAWPEEKHRGAMDDANIQHLIIESIPNNQPVGFVILAGLQSEHRNIEFMRIVITEKGKGYGRAAVQAIKQHAFERLAAHRLWLDVKEHNIRARTLYENEGFRYEGTLRECLKGPKGFESLVVMSLLEQEWLCLIS